MESVRRLLWLGWWGAVACGPGGATVDRGDDDDDENPTIDTDIDTEETDLPPDTDTDTTDTDTDTTDTGPTSVGMLSNISAAVDADYPTLIRVGWEQSEAATVHLAFSWDEGIWHESPPRELPAGPHEELILGAPYATDVTWRIAADRGGTATTTQDAVTATGEVPDEMPQAFVVTAVDSGWDPAMPHVLVAVTEGRFVHQRVWTMLIDRQGRTVWGHRSPENRSTLHPRISWNEDAFLIDHCSFWADLDQGAASEVLSVKIDGTVSHVWATPGQHHPFTELPDGSLAYAAYINAQNGRAEDDLIVIVAPDGSTRDLVGCEALLAAVGEPEPDFYCGSNTLSFDLQRNAFLFSLFTHDSIFQIDADTGAGQRLFGHANGAYGFSPPAAAFWYQHGPHFTDAGTLLVSSHATEHSDELVVREYQIDDKNQQLVEVWSFGEGEGVVGSQLGEAHRLPNGNTLHNHGTHAVIREITPAGQVVWDVRWEQQQYNADPTHEIGRSAPVLLDLYSFAPERP